MDLLGVLSAQVHTDLDNFMFWQVSFWITCRAPQAYSLLACAPTCLPSHEPRWANTEINVLLSLLFFVMSSYNFSSPASALQAFLQLISISVQLLREIERSLLWIFILWILNCFIVFCFSYSTMWSHVWPFVEIIAFVEWPLV